MTGFGTASGPFKQSKIRVEISGVNRKQTEVSINLPRAWAEQESSLRKLIAPQVSRGRVQVAILLEQNGQEEAQISINEAKLAKLSAHIPQLEKSLQKEVSISLGSLQRLGIIEESQEEEICTEELAACLHSAVQAALDKFLQMRKEEGDNMCQDLLSRIGKIRDYRGQIMLKAPCVILRHKENLLKRLEESGLPLPADDDRIIKEIALFADRCDISEEMTRLASHLDQFEKMSKTEEALGRPLDFLCQEIFRELNTTGSKANDAELAQLVVTAKTELEKIREQVQNVE